MFPNDSSALIEYDCYVLSICTFMVVCFFQDAIANNTLGVKLRNTPVDGDYTCTYSLGSRRQEQVIDLVLLDIGKRLLKLDT